MIRNFADVIRAKMARDPALAEAINNEMNNMRSEVEQIDGELIVKGVIVPCTECGYHATYECPVCRHSHTLYAPRLGRHELTCLVCKVSSVVLVEREET